ncbi:MAG: hypothetical protein ACWA6U_07855 [Breznakibacter sp.]|jgi:hypothetical protein
MSQSFHYEAKLFVRRAINMRKAMIKRGVSLASEAPAITRRLEQLLNYWPYNTNVTMARFIHNHRAEILYILPGVNCKAYKSFIDRFNAIVQRSEQVLKLDYEPVC